MSSKRQQHLHVTMETTNGKGNSIFIVKHTLPNVKTYCWPDTLMDLIDKEFALTTVNTINKVEVKGVFF